MAAHRMGGTIQRRLYRTENPAREETPNNRLEGRPGVRKRTETDHLVAVNIRDLFNADPGAEGTPGREGRIAVKIRVIDAITVREEGKEEDEHNPPHHRASRGSNKGKRCARDRRGRRERTEDDRADSRPSSGVSSTKSKIFYSGEFLKKSAEELWPEATLPRKTQTNKRGERDILKNRSAKVITMDMLRHRNKGRGAKGTCPPIKPGVSGEDGKSQKGVREKPFQRFKPTSAVRKEVVPKLKAAPVLREYIENKADTKGDQSRRRQTGEDHEPSSSPNPYRYREEAYGGPKKRRVDESPRQEGKGAYIGKRFSTHGSPIGEPPTPRTLQMPPP